MGAKSSHQNGSRKAWPLFHWAFIGTVALFGGLALVMALIAFGASYMRRQHDEINVSNRPPNALLLPGETEMTFSGPALQTRPAMDLRSLRAWENEELNTYGWIDRDRGVVRLPIERAMRLMAERGFPVRGEVEESGEGKTPLDLIRERTGEAQPNQRGQQ